MIKKTQKIGQAVSKIAYWAKKQNKPHSICIFVAKVPLSVKLLELSFA